MINWKTTISGLIAIGLQVAAIWAPNVLGNPKVVQTIQIASLATGLVAAKDNDVTGGTKQQ